MATYKRKQGDSLWIDITCDAVSEIDPVWANWSGTFNIAQSAGTLPLVSGLMDAGTEGIFYLRIGPRQTTGWKTLPAGTYLLTMQIDNATVDYRHEEQAKLIVQAQGFTDL